MHMHLNAYAKFAASEEENILLITRFGRIDVKMSKILGKIQYVDYLEQLK